MSDKHVKGIALAGLTALISGAANYANGMVVTGIDPLVHTTVKNVLVGLLVIGVITQAKSWKGLSSLNKSDWLKLWLIAIIGGSVPFVLFFTGLKEIGGLEGSFIHKTLIFWVAFMAMPLLKEKVSLKMWAGILLLYASNFVFMTPLKSSTWLNGHSLVLMATWMWAVENILAKKMLKHIATEILVGARMVLGSLILLGMTFVSGKGALILDLTGRQWLMLFGVALLLFGYVMTWYKALASTRVTLVASILVGATVVTNVLTALGTKIFTFEHLAQAMIIVTGAWLVVMAMLDTPKKQPDERHTWIRG